MQSQDEGISNLTHVDLFAGIGGFSVAMERAGVKTVAAAEIDKNCREVLARHWPTAKVFSDIQEVTGDDLRAVGFTPERGVITAGWPCQGNSVAGRRGGMADERSGLWKEVYRLLDEVRPAYFIGENVPGLLSVNSGKDIRLILNDLNDLGYVVSMDILDAQFFGVPQRGRRLFFVCQRVEDILQRRTTTSAITISQLLIETLQLISGALQLPSPTGRRSSASSRIDFADGLAMRTRLFGLDAGRLSLENLLQNLAEGPAKYRSGLGLSALSTVASAELAIALGTSSSEVAETLPFWSTGLSWSSIWDDVYDLTRLCTTSTPSKMTIDSKIYSCAMALLDISAHTVHWMDSSPAFSMMGSSISTALKGYIDYARQASESLFGDLAGDDRWADFIRSAECLVESLRRLGDSGRSPAEVLFEPQGMSGDSSPSGEEEPETPTSTEAGTDDGRAAVRVTSPPLSAHRGVPSADESDQLVMEEPIAFHMTQDPISGDVSPCLSGNAYIGVAHQDVDPVAALTANGVGTCGADDNQAQAGHLIVDNRPDA